MTVKKPAKSKTAAKAKTTSAKVKAKTTSAKTKDKTASAKARELRLVKEAKIQDLIGDSAGTRLEASGVLHHDGAFLIVCDNLPSLIRVGSELSSKAPDNEVLKANLAQKKGSSANAGYEDLAHDTLHDHYFTLTEAEPVKPKGYRARVHEYDAKLRPLGSALLDFDLTDANKGMEGLEWVDRAGAGYLLALCEGNQCAGGKKGRTPGGGRIHVFRREGKRWTRTDTIRLPESLPFEDYSSVSVRDDRIAVLSQASSALWVGRLSAKKWEVDAGTVHPLPTDGKGRTVYGNPEGVSWVSADHVVIVSDRAKKGAGNERFRAKDQSVHLFLIPGDRD
ncbi:hypothetical protein GCM10010329_68170 [Streptomyces spiroverticillatus]|uniref:Uncharacterized protein n=1 Tax=Streptomyces finlayi TaxID=67296 RepID=A0A918X517_9ACTN|nr:hypothetical protein [Streptomyces finlayi]GHA35366.1 hypothetical protein GCM10010329_68170 [Streptomyces spiroverticillatus]GHD12905.1 hypothetical protein GCM10010334_70510 [Streptomyces finlayi]